MSLINNTAALYPVITAFPYPKAGETNSAARVGVIDNIHVAPTIAHLLGVELPGARGKVLREILE